MLIIDWSSDVCSSDLNNETKINWSLKNREAVSIEEKPIRRNSSLALERLRGIVDQLEQEGRRQLPTERELAEQIGVGRRAVRRALAVLEAEGRIWRRQGAGTFLGRSEEHTSELQSLMRHSY